MANVASLAPIEVEDEETILIIHKLSSPSYANHIRIIFTYLITDDFTLYDYLKTQTILQVQMQNIYTQAYTHMHLQHFKQPM